MTHESSHIVADIEALPDYRIFGRVSAVQGLLIEVAGVERHLTLGGRCEVVARGGRPLLCEVVGFRDDRALLLPFQALDGVGLGCKAEVAEAQPTISPTPAWLGRVINALGEPIDGGPPLPVGDRHQLIRNMPPQAHKRQRVGGKLDLGVRAINTFLSCCKGQRMGIFAGSGVGKSILMSMVARYTSADVAIIGLIGERGREVQEFIHDDLGPEGLARSVVIVATSDEAPLMRRQAAFMTLAVAEYFRDIGKDVLCLMDSVTRFAMAQREIGLAAGEPPTTKGYPPTTFAELPKLLERAGPGEAGKGTITGLFTVLVDGDDHNEPIADAARGILDGHIVLDRSIAERGRYPAINILRSVSRTMPACNTDNENELVSAARRYLSSYENMAEMIRLGAYRRGTNPEVDEAMTYYGPIESFLSQYKNESDTIQQGYKKLASILGRTQGALDE
ncbi:MAG: flagellar protein export ATPase FliI [Proteobacteria bacterium]|jgi:flagellum-specific ATP synthase|nr:flagellar protein export ATPase FliI [Alphaproteobacteria bacterium]NCC02702.1 flagellar protein export ATPase FliI [Pseudomonadota bacterium]